MKLNSKYLAIITMSLSGLTAIAQSADTDTISVKELDEVVVEAPKVVRKADMDLFFPSKSAVDASKTGVQLLRNLMIPTMSVNDVLGTVTSRGKPVQLRINGREASIAEIRNLLPETIKRVEWIENPGLKYNGAETVVNFIVINPTLGGSLMAGAMPSLKSSWGVYNGSLKLNNGRSQWGLSSNFKLTNKIKSHREYNEIFTYPDGSTLTRIETPIDGYVDNSFLSVQADYSYIKPDTTVFWMALHAYKQYPEVTFIKSRMHMSTGADYVLLRDYTSNKGFTPSVRAYFEQHFKHNQVIAIDFSASLYNGRSAHDYTEEVAETGMSLTDVNTSIRDCNQAYGLEANYIKRWKKSRLTAGAQYKMNRNRSVYENLNDAVFHQTQDRVYFFSEYFQSINRLTLTAGIGAQYTSFHFRETDKGNSTWNLRPQFTATYRFNNGSGLRLNFTSWQSAPSLMETNITPQQIDGFQWRVGNPDLKTSSSYMISFGYNFTLPRVMGAFGIRAFTSPNAITPYMEWRGDRLVTSYENSKGLENLTFYLSPQIDIIPGWLSVNGTIQYKAERMRGRNYKWYNHNWSGDVTGMLYHWGFSLIVQYEKAACDLWGEKLSWGESISLVALSYNWKNWEFTGGMFCPFSKYDQGSKSLNKYNLNENHMRIEEIALMPFLQIRYNLHWGKQKNGARKLINSEVEVDKSKASGR